MLIRNNSWLLRFSLLVTLALLLLSLLPGLPMQETQAQGTQGISYTFPQTGRTVRGRFLQYWQGHGGLSQQGYPISDEIGEVSATDGKLYTVQYFERAIFEYHPENTPPNDVLLSLLGVFRYNAKYPGLGGAPGQQANTSPGTQLFPQTGHKVGGGFLDYWKTHGGLAQQGYPLSEEFSEVSELDGRTYVVQYFERGVFEYHPENPPATRILLSQLGALRYRSKYSAGSSILLAPYPVPPALQPTNGQYSGQLINGVREGQGTFTWNNGDRYTGEWHNDLMNGQGVLQYANQAVYQGGFADDKRSGQGTMTWLDGDNYVGAWANDLMEGYGTYSFASGASYVGEWVGGKMQGQGTYRFADGTVVTGQWYDNSYIGN